MDKQTEGEDEIGEMEASADMYTRNKRRSLS